MLEWWNALKSAPFYIKHIFHKFFTMGSILAKLSGRWHCTWEIAEQRIIFTNSFIVYFRIKLFPVMSFGCFNPSKPKIVGAMSESPPLLTVLGR